MKEAITTQHLFPKPDKTPKFEMHIIDGMCYVDYLVYADLWHRYQDAVIAKTDHLVDLMKAKKERDELNRQLKGLQTQSPVRRNTVKDFRCKMEIVKGEVL